VSGVENLQNYFNQHTGLQNQNKSVLIHFLEKKLRKLCIKENWIFCKFCASLAHSAGTDQNSTQKLKYVLLGKIKYFHKKGK